eukprot:127045_1
MSDSKVKFTALSTIEDDEDSKTEDKDNGKENEEEKYNKTENVVEINNFPETRCVIVEANWRGWALSDDGNFTESIVKIFTENLKKIRKDSWSKLIQDITSNLQKLSNQTEICTPIGTFPFDVRFIEKSKTNKQQLESRN